MIHYIRKHIFILGVVIGDCTLIVNQSISYYSFTEIHAFKSQLIMKSRSRDAIGFCIQKEEAMAGNREYKSDVFSMLMENPINALELYNAMNGSNYMDPEMVEMCRLDGGISLSVRTDAAFILDMRLSIYEHQSTVCTKMPRRSFIYLSTILKRVIKNRNIYGRTLVKIPTPQFAIFYNGEEEQSEQYELRLSDAFERPVENPELELRCTVYNINGGRNKELLEKCSFLREYMIFVDCVRTYLAEDDFMELEHAIDNAIDDCIKENVLRDFLMERRSEVVKVMTLDYTFERQLMLEREEAVTQGLEEGMTKGLEEGMTKGLEEGMAKGLEEGMAKGLEEGMAKGLEEGIEKGIEKGMEKGLAVKLIRQTYKKYVKNYTIEEVADMLEEDTETIGKVYEAIKAADTDDTDKIYDYFCAAK